MGRETHCEAQLGEQRGKVHALLEANEIILRGAIRARLPLATLRELVADADALTAQAPQGPLVLALGAREADTWLQRIRNPPSLASKLGVVAGTAVHVIDDHPEPRAVLQAARAEFVALDEAALVFVVIENEAQLQALRERLAQRAPGAAVWVLRLKGAQAAIKEAAIMAAMKALGMGPSKTAAWSEHYTSDRYGQARR